MPWNRTCRLSPIDMGSLLHDIRYSSRVLKQSPGFAVVVILTLAIGIGANTAIFSIVDAVLLRPLPFEDAGRLVRIVDHAPGIDLHDIGMSVPELQDLAKRSGVFEHVSAAWPVDANITGGGRPERVEFLAVSPSYFTMLGAHAALGRVFGPQDEAQGFAEAVVISDGLWRRLFGANPNIIGSRIRADNDAYTIVGVMPPGFRHPGKTVSTETELWGTAGFAADPFGPPKRNARILPGALGRLKASLDIREAQSRLDSFTAALQREFPNEYREQLHWTVQLEPLRDSIVGNVRPLLLILLGAVAMVLLIGCVNVANLLLARASGRQREVAIRQALGAARWRLIRQLLTESVLLSICAGAVGVLAASWTLNLFVTFMPAKIPRLNDISLDLRVLIFALFVSTLTGLLFGMAPALQVSGYSLVEKLKDSSRGAGRSHRQSKVSNLLVISEFAVCMILLIGAGLLARSFWNLTHLNPGFDPTNVLVARLWLPQPNDLKADPYAQPKDRSAFAREVIRRVKSLPGVNTVAMSTNVPLSGNRTSIPLTIEASTRSSKDATLADFISVSPDYFTVLGTPLLQGRGFSEADQLGASRVAIVDRTTARRFWPGTSALGKRFKLGPVQSTSPWAEVVGIVGDVRHEGMDVDGIPHVYFPIYQFIGKALGVVLRSGSDPAALSEAVRREIQAVDPNLPVFGIRTLDQMVNVSLAQPRFSAELVGLFAILALLLAAVGIYGVLANSIGQRTREIGIRIALGARRSEVVRMVLWQGIRLILVGVAVGTISALAFSRLLSRLLHGVSTADPIVFGAVPVVLILVALVASYLPAVRATRIDPIVALRCE